MAERRTQAPVALSVNEQSPVNEQATTNPGHIDQSGYSKTPLTEELVEAKGLDQDLPNNTEELNAKLEEHPVAFHEGTITTEKPANKRWTIKRGIAAAAIGIATAGGIFGAQKAFGNEYIEGEDGMLYSPDVVATAPMLADEAPSASTETKTFSNPEFAHAVETLASMREESAKELREQGMSIVLESAADDNSSEALLGKYQSDLHSVLKVGMTDTEEAKRLLVGVISPENIDDFNGISNDIIGKYGEDFIPKFGFAGVQDWSDNFYTPMIDGVNANGSAMRYISASTVPNADIWHQITFRRDDGEWIVHKMVTVDDPSFVTDTIAFNQTIPR